MYRTHTCGELSINHTEQSVSLAGWVQRIRNLGGMIFVDLRDRYGITQAIVDGETEKHIYEQVGLLGREDVVQLTGTVRERSSKNVAMQTGDVELYIQEVGVLNKSQSPPFTIEDDTDGGDELRMKYRYLDLRRMPLQSNLALRSLLGMEVRSYLHGLGFMDIETPFLIKSTPEGARDFIVPSRMKEGGFYALPQSPQIFKQLLMVSGYDRYYQIVKCFRDEDLRADRQPEFTQIDCELSFVEQQDVLDVFEGMMKHLFKIVKQCELSSFDRLSYAEAMELYGTDKPDLRFDMKISDVSERVRGKGFSVFDSAPYVGAIVAPVAHYSRKQIDALIEWVKSPHVGGKGLVYVQYKEDGSVKSSIGKFYEEQELKGWGSAFSAKKGDALLMMCGEREDTLVQLGRLRLEMGRVLGLMSADEFKPLWVVDFPLLEWDEESGRYHAMHHPFTSPKIEDLELLESSPEKVRANAYDMVINGVEIGGGSIRIHERDLQNRVFRVLGMSDEQISEEFGFLLEAFQYGAPPHGGIAFGFDRMVSLFAGISSIRDVIAFPKNNRAQDVMMDSPSNISQEQLDELGLSLKSSLDKKSV